MPFNREPRMINKRPRREIKIVQIAVSPSLASDLRESVYGVDAAGTVYEYSFYKLGWIPLSMEVLDDA